MAAQLRISGGKHKNKKLVISTRAVTRPAQALVRAALFNWLEHQVAGSRCLDLFAGTGILSWEFLSRGAARAVLIEQNPIACRDLRAQAGELGYGKEQALVLRRNVYTWLRRRAPADHAGSFDYVFIDPPYETDYFAKCLFLLLQQDLLAPGGRVFYEINKQVYLASDWLQQPLQLGGRTYQQVKSNHRGNTYFGLIALVD